MLLLRIDPTPHVTPPPQLANRPTHRMIVGSEQRGEELRHSREPTSFCQGVAVCEYPTSSGLRGQATVEELPLAATPRASRLRQP